MQTEWSYQVRVHLGDGTAELARSDPGNPAIKPLADILAKHRATLKCQFDSFSEYVAEAEMQGVEEFPLYKWTKATLEDADKRAKHLRSFVVHVAGDQVYAKSTADSLEADLQPLVGGEIVTRLSRHDTNPATNIPVPAHLRS